MAIFGDDDLTVSISNTNSDFGKMVDAIEDLDSVVNKATGSLGAGEMSLTGTISSLAKVSGIAAANIKKLTDAIRTVNSSASNFKQSPSQKSSSVGGRYFDSADGRKVSSYYKTALSSFVSPGDVSKDVRQSLLTFMKSDRESNITKNALASRVSRLGVQTTNNVIKEITSNEINKGISKDPQKLGKVLDLFGKAGNNATDKLLSTSRDKVSSLLREISSNTKDTSKSMSELDGMLKEAKRQDKGSNMASKFGSAMLSSGLTVGSFAADKYLINSPDNGVGVANRTQGMGSLLGGGAGLALGMALAPETFGLSLLLPAIGATAGGIAGGAIGKNKSQYDLSKTLFDKNYGFTSNLSNEDLASLKFAGNLNTIQGNQFDLAKNVGQGLLKAREKNVFGDINLNATQEQQLIGQLTNFAKAGTLTGKDLGSLAKSGLSLPQISDISSKLYGATSFKFDSAGAINKYREISQNSGQFAANAYAGFENQDYKGQAITNAYSQAAFGMDFKDVEKMSSTKGGMSKLYNTALERLGGSGKSPEERAQLAKMQINTFGNAEIAGIFNAGSPTGSGNVKDAKDLSQQMVDYLKDIRDLMSKKEGSTVHQLGNKFLAQSMATLFHYHSQY